MHYEPSDLSELIANLGSTDHCPRADDHELLDGQEAFRNNCLGEHEYLLKLIYRFNKLAWIHEKTILGTGIGMLPDRYEYARIRAHMSRIRDQYWDYFGRPRDQPVRTFVGIPW